MTENAELLKKRFFSRKMDSKELSSLGKNSYVKLFSSSSYNSPHSSERVLLFDSIVELLIRFHNLRENENGAYIVHRTSVVKSIDGGRRYLYHGGERGRFDGFFSPNDDFFIVRKKTKQTDGGHSVDSVPRWNMAHFFCDYLASDAMCAEAVDWVFSDFCWLDSLHLKVCSDFGSKNSK